MLSVFGGQFADFGLEVLDPLPLVQGRLKQFVKLGFKIADPILGHLELKYAEFSVIKDALGRAQFGTLLRQTLHVLFD